MRDGHNGYLASAGILEAREAVADDYTRPRRGDVSRSASSSRRARPKASSWR